MGQANRTAASPVVCRDGERARVVWAEQSRRATYLFALPTDRRGEGATMVWAGGGKVLGLACSPDGRTLAFGYEGDDFEGPGTYLVASREGLWAPPTRIDPVPARAVAWAPALASPELHSQAKNSWPTAKSSK